jgi:hypothetical protein
MPDINLILDHAEALIRRVSPEGRARARRLRERRRQARKRLAFRLLLVAVAVAVATGAIGLAVALTGAILLLATAIFALAAILVARLSRDREPNPEAIGRTDLALLPQRTEEWLERQRPSLPLPAARLLDRIGAGLAAMSPQLEGLEPGGPAAGAVRKLLCDELPDLIRGYQRVPAPLRREEGGSGTMPDRQLVQGLEIIDSQIARMTGQLASGDLDLLATRNRYLELKYRSGDGFEG